MVVEGGWRARAGLLLAALLAAAGAAWAQPAPRLLEQCAACHGPGGNAQIAHYPSLAGQPSLFIENQLVIMREGLRVVPSMDPVLKGLSDEAIVGLARHFAALPSLPAPAPVRAEAYRLGAQLSKQLLCGTAICPPTPANNRCRAWPGRTRLTCCKP